MSFWKSQSLSFGGITTAKTLTSAYVYSDAIDVSECNNVMFGIVYTKGDETSAEFIVRVSFDGSLWFDGTLEMPDTPVGSYLNYVSKTASQNFAKSVPNGYRYARLGIKATGGTPTGTVSGQVGFNRV